MIKLIKRLIYKTIYMMGYDMRVQVRKKGDQGAYDGFVEDSLQNKRFYNIGAGGFTHPYWTNIDYSSEYYGVYQKSFINYNLMELEPFPIEDNVAELIYSSHVIEHVSDEAVRNMLKESYRILKPGGGIRITTPDAWLELQAYNRKDIKFWTWVNSFSESGTWENLYHIPLSKASIHQLFLHHFASQLCEIDLDDSPSKKFSDAEIIAFFSANPNVDALDHFTKQCVFNPKHPGNHINWWTHEKLISFMKEAGFSSPYISGYGKSIYPPLRDTFLFDTTYPEISIFVEAMK